MNGPDLRDPRDLLALLGIGALGWLTSKWLSSIERDHWDAVKWRNRSA